MLSLILSACFLWDGTGKCKLKIEMLTIGTATPKPEQDFHRDESGKLKA